MKDGKGQRKGRSEKKKDSAVLLAAAVELFDSLAVAGSHWRRELAALRAGLGTQAAGQVVFQH